MISALRFVPIADRRQAFGALSNNACVEEQAVLDYFETNYRLYWRTSMWREDA